MDRSGFLALMPVQNSDIMARMTDSKSKSFDADPALRAAWEFACANRKKAHAPYSKFYVGAALKLKGVSELIPGCNVENASYGATVCAERTAFQVARALYGDFEPEFLMLVTDTSPAAAPCALCLQVFSEFCDGSFPIYLANTKGIQKLVHFDSLLPIRFDRSQLK